MIEIANQFILPAAFALLPASMDRPEARAQLLAIGLQESKFEARVQRVPGSIRTWWSGGPARSFWQFEAGGGVKGVAEHPTSAPALARALQLLGYQPDTSISDIHGLIAHNDVLAAVCARLLLRTDPKPLPRRADGPEAAWQCYVCNWRPGKPHRETWDAYWQRAWRMVEPVAAAA